MSSHSHSQRHHDKHGSNDDDRRERHRDDRDDRDDRRDRDRDTHKDEKRDRGEGSSSHRSSHKSHRRDESHSKPHRDKRHSSDDDSSGNEDETKNAPKVELRRGVWTINGDDYFQKATEFRVWLQKAKGIMFEDLSSRKAHKHFKTFCEQWNALKLDDMYYSGIPATVLEQTTRTKHTWSFTRKLDDEERLKLQSLRDGIDAETNRSKGVGAGSSVEPRKVVGPTMPTRDEFYAARGDAARHDRAADKKLFAKHMEAVDEIAPKLEGREAMIAKRKAESERIHAASRRDAADTLEIDEGTLMGASNDSFQAALAAQRRQQTWRDQKRQQALAEAEAREEARVAAFKAQMGIRGDETFVIPE